MRLRVSPFLSVVEGAGPNGGAVLANDATGAHFAVDALTLRFIDWVRRLGSARAAAQKCGVAPDVEAPLTK